MELAVAALDRLVDFVDRRGGKASARDAAEHLLAIRRPSLDVAISLIEPLVEADARLDWDGGFVTHARPKHVLIDDARFVVFDLETTGLPAGRAQICEIGAVRVRARTLAETFEALVAPSEAATALDRFSAFAGDDILVAHNARFDVGFVNHELARCTGSRLGGTVIDTLPLARNLLRGRIERTNLAALAVFFGVSVEPCHRALPDALATAEVFVRLIELARERGVSTVAGLADLARPGRSAGA